MKVSFDTNVLVYAEGVNGHSRQSSAQQIISLCPRRSTIIPLQVLAELFNVLVRRGGYSRVDAQRTILTWQYPYEVAETTLASFGAAASLATIHQLSIWDAMVVAVAADSGCRLLLSEDMHEGFTWDGVTVVNPFAPTWHPLLEVALGGPKPPPDGIIVEE